MSSRFVLPRPFVVDGNGHPLAGAKMSFFRAGTSEVKDTYADVDLATPNANPVNADANGTFPDIFLATDELYRVELRTAAGVVIYTADSVGPQSSSTLAYRATGAGTVSRSVRDKLDEVVSVLDYGAHLDGVTDDTAAWLAALTTGRSIYFPEGLSMVSDRIVFSGAFGQRIVGAGRHKSQFVISYTSFNMTASSVIKLGAVYQGITGVGFDFEQPSTNLRSEVKAYPWAIDLDGHARAELSSLHIAGAWNGIRAEGNCGGAVIDDIQIGAFSTGLLLDGARDSVRVNRYHFWPFDFSGDAGLMAVYGDGNTLACRFGLCDDLNIGSILSFQGRVLFEDMGSGSTFGVASAITLDSNFGRLEFSAGEMAIAALYSSTGTAGDFLIHQEGGELKISSLALEAGVDTNYLVHVQAGSFLASSVFVTNYGVNTSAFRQTGGVMQLCNGRMITGTDDRAVPLIDVQGGIAVVQGISVSDAGAAVGDFIKIHADNHHVIAGNTTVGWSIATPTDKRFGIYGPNIGTPTGVSGNDYVAPLHVKKLTGTLDAGGSAVLAHGVASGNTRVARVSAWYTGPSGEKVPASITYVDGSAVGVSGGAPGANRPCVVWIEYT